MKRTKIENYNPHLLYVLVNKKVNDRYYISSKSEERKNPPSGSVILEAMSRNNAYDFYLTAQFVTQGSCTPTHYIVAYNKGKIPQEALVEFTYEQCFNYFNWAGAVRVPACLQYSEKLSRLMNEHVQAPAAEEM